jgi:hypothetical protein
MYPDNLILGGPSSVVIACGWTDRNRVANLVTGYDVAAIGNLYSVAGISLLIRNLAENYQISRLVYIHASALDRNVPVTETLLGVWGGDIILDLPTGIQRAVVDRVELCPITQLSDLLPLLDKPCNDLPYHYPQIHYPIPSPIETPKSSVYTNGMFILAADLSEAWYRLLAQVSDHGYSVRGQHGGIIDLGSILTVLPMGTDFDIPRSMTQGSLDQYAQTLLSRELVGDAYTYGQRIGGQLDQVVTILQRNPNSNRAVINLWQPTDLDSDYPPCLVTIGYQIRADRLYCRAVFRSHDIGNGWYPNSYALIQLSRKLLGLLQYPDLMLGDLSVLSESAHIYDAALPNVRSILGTDAPKTLTADPVGDFVIRVRSEGVTIDHYEFGGLRWIRDYQDPAGVLASNPLISTAHYGYLCAEYARANLLGSDYKQDRK